MLSSCLYLVSNCFNLIDVDLPIEKIKKCMGDPEADVENEVLKTEQVVQVNFYVFLHFAASKLIFI